MEGHMRRTVILLCILTVSAAGALEAGSPTYPVYLYPVIAKNAGVAGSNWTTEVCCTNFNNSTSLPVYFFFVQDGEISYWQDDLPAYKTICYSDIVGEVLGLSEWQGALLITADPDVTYDWETTRFVTRVKVYNSTAGGKYGLSVSPEIDHYGIGEPVHFHYTDGSDDDLFLAIGSGVQNYGQPGFTGERTSIGYVNLGYDSSEGTFSRWQEVKFNVYDRQGNFLYQKSRTVAPLKQGQFTIPESVVVRGGFVKMNLLGDPYDYWGEPGLDFYGYMTITDNRSGDGTYTPFRYPYDGGNTYKKSASNASTGGRDMISALLKAGTKVLRPSGRMATD
jgi:hypothetical protein